MLLLSSSSSSSLELIGRLAASLSQGSFSLELFGPRNYGPWRGLAAAAFRLIVECPPLSATLEVQKPLRAPPAPPPARRRPAHRRPPARRPRARTIARSAAPLALPARLSSAHPLGRSATRLLLWDRRPPAIWLIVMCLPRHLVDCYVLAARSRCSRCP